MRWKPVALALAAVSVSHASWNRSLLLLEQQAPVVEVFMYRAMQVSQEALDRPLENVNLADLPGVLQYLHREIVVDHQVSPPKRPMRKYSIDGLVQVRVLLRNPKALLTNPGWTRNQEFGEFVTYDYGQATNRAQHWPIFVGAGDFAGVQLQVGRYVNFADPYYWFSLSGACPNLPYTCTEGYVKSNGEMCHSEPALTTNLCTETSPCRSKAQANSACFDISSRPGEEIASCLCYSDSGETMQGGLCRQDGILPETAMEPTGAPGCVYSYDLKSTVVKWDDLVGITKETCKGAPCKDWNDFRLNCDNAEYKWTFTATGRTAKSPYCVEYDLHPNCASHGCEHQLCKSISEGDRELGLPFWRGRCRAEANQRRAETAAAAFGVPNALTSHRYTQASTDEYAATPCDLSSFPGHATSCKANALFGNGFCTREYSGVCTRCKIVGAKKSSARSPDGFCPWRVGRDPSEYVAKLQGGKSCKLVDGKTRARDVCCLYSDSCTAHDVTVATVAANVDSLPIDDSGGSDSVGLVMASMDTQVVRAFVKRVLLERFKVGGEKLPAMDADLDAFAYSAWDIKPQVRHLNDQQGYDMRLFLVHVEELVPNPCPPDASLSEAGGCVCSPGFSGDIEGSEDIGYSGICTAVACPVGSTGSSVVKGCTCKKAYRGSVTASQGAPYFIGGCEPEPCPSGSEGKSLPEGCTCEAGRSGRITAAARAPFYFGKCTAAQCPSHSTGDGVSDGCVCDEGYGGLIVPATIAPYYEGSCILGATTAAPTTTAALTTTAAPTTTAALTTIAASTSASPLPTTEAVSTSTTTEATSSRTEADATTVRPEADATTVRPEADATTVRPEADATTVRPADTIDDASSAGGIHSLLLKGCMTISVTSGAALTDTPTLRAALKVGISRFANLLEDAVVIEKVSAARRLAASDDAMRTLKVNFAVRFTDPARSPEIAADMGAVSSPGAGESLSAALLEAGIDSKVEVKNLDMTSHPVDDEELDSHEPSEAPDAGVTTGRLLVMICFVLLVGAAVYGLWPSDASGDSQEAAIELPERSKKRFNPMD